MKIRFQADNDLHEDILRSVKRLQPAIDFQRAPELGLNTGIDAPVVLKLCAQENRMLVTHDRHTYARSLYRVHQRSRLTRHLHRFQETAHRQSRRVAGVVLGNQRSRVGVSLARVYRLSWADSDES